MLTKRQKQIMDLFQNFIKKHGYPPSLREMGRQLGLSSPATVHTHIKNLKAEGYLSENQTDLQPLEYVPYKWSGEGELPVLGVITAGQPIEAVEERETMALPMNLVSNKENSYVLRVRGDSMIEDGIFDGDFVIVEHNPSPRNGDVVVALLNNAYATLKRFYQEPHRIRLQPANHRMKPIFCKDVIIQGVVRAVIRKFQNV